MAGPVRQMAQQHGLKTGVLPEDVNSVVGCKLERSCVALRIEADLIVVQKREALFGRLTLLLEQFKTHQCKLDPRKRIAGARAQFLNKKMDGQSGMAGQVL